MCPIDKKSDKQVINNYRPVSLLPICGKVFEILIFNSVYEYLEEKLAVEQFVAVLLQC